MNQRRFYARLALFLIGLALAVALVEIGVRSVGLDPFVSQPDILDPRGADQDCLRPAPWYGFERIPGRCGANAFGFVDRERVVEKEPGTLRVLVLGDSISEHRTWVELLEQLLNPPGTGPVEVWNLGLSGYGTLEELEVLRRKALAWQPDLVLLQFCLNDYAFTPSLFSFRGQVWRLNMRTQGLGPGSLWLFRKSALYRYIVYGTLRPDKRPGIGEERGRQVDAALGEMRDLCQRQGVPFRIVVFPELLEPGDPEARFTEPRRRVLAAARVQEIPLLDLTTAMGPGELPVLVMSRSSEAYADLDALLSRWGRDPAVAPSLRALPKRSLNLETTHDPRRPPDTIHPNFLGHYLAAQATADWLVEDGVVGQ